MAVHPPHPPNTAAELTDSDYGSDIDIDDATADALFSRAKSQSPLNHPPPPTILESVEQAPFIAELEEDVYTHNFSVRLAQLRSALDGGEERRAKVAAMVQERRRRDAAVEVEYDERNRRTFSPSNAEETAPAPEPPRKNGEREKKGKDTRTPLQRFKARRPLSVTNLVSPSWCEQQYEYNLSRHGRIPATKAMAAGTTAHKELEEQVHVEVPVEVVSREDRHGLRMWNTIQGLRALRETGLTRELEVWGVLEGEVVNGIIDEITIECPDPGTEARILQQVTGDGAAKGKKDPQFAPDQRTLTDFLTGSPQGSMLESHPAFLSTLRDRRPTYYIKDIKTTKRGRSPTHPAYTRGAHIQLMLYHRILSTLAANEVSAQAIFDRYRLDARASFSDKFIAELANLDLRAYASVPNDADLPPSQRDRDPLTELLGHNDLSSLWTLLMSELQRTFPPAPSASTKHQQPSSLSPLLTVEYRNPTSPATASVIGTHSFPVDRSDLSSYLRSEVAWWRGERPTVGVSVEDAWKCGWCEFASECEWRRDKVAGGLERARLRAEGLGKSGV